MINAPTIIIDSVSDSSESRLCNLKLNRGETGGFSADLSGVEYLPGQTMDVVAMYNPVHDEVFLRVTSGGQKLIGVASGLGSIFEATVSIKADTELRITIEEEQA
jgi:hypothetical protein